MSQIKRNLMNSPKVFLFNLNWNGVPNTLDILRILISLPT